MSGVKVAQLCLTLCDPMDYTVHGIIQANILECVAIPFSRNLPNPGIEPRSSTLQADSLPAEPQGKPKYLVSLFKNCVSLQGEKALWFWTSRKPAPHLYVVCDPFGGDQRRTEPHSWAVACLEVRTENRHKKWDTVRLWAQHAGLAAGVLLGLDTSGNSQKFRQRRGR